jgi:glycosyltransferase 2 family protein
MRTPDAELSVRVDTRTVLRGLIAITLTIFFVRYFSDQWTQLRSTAQQLHPDWAGVALASICFLAGYAVLIATWRMLLALWNSPLSFAEATRIWFVSSLGKYIPGKIWAIGAMAILAKEAGASPVAATGSSIVMALVNIAAGFLVVVLAGAGELFAIYPVLRYAAWATLGLSVVGVVYGPQLLTWSMRNAARVLRQPTTALPLVSRRTLLGILLANVVAWLAYGVGFGLLSNALLNRTGGVSLAVLAVYTASYLIGYLVPVAPGGIGVRESMLILLLTTLKLATPADAGILALVSRIWLTVLEVLPGLAFLPSTSLRRRSSISSPDGTSL